MLNYLDILEIAKNYFMIIGKSFSFEKKQADVGNVIIFKKNETLYLIDTGACNDFREVLLTKCRSLYPIKKIILLNSHGHCDHVCNNSILNELEADEKKHYISVHDFDLMFHNHEYFVNNLKKVAPFMDGDFDVEKIVSEFLSWFGSMNVNTRYLTTLETVTTEDIQIGRVHWTGWKFADDLYVLRTEGHTKGHIIFYFPEIQHIHMADEINGYCHVFHENDNFKTLESHTKLLSMLNEGTVKSITGSHAFKLFDQNEAMKEMRSLIHSHYIYEHQFQKILLANPQGLTFSQITDALKNNEDIKKLSDTANLNPLFNTLMILTKFKDFGIVPNDQKNLAKALFQFKGKK